MIKYIIVGKNEASYTFILWPFVIIWGAIVLIIIILKKNNL